MIRRLFLLALALGLLSLSSCGENHEAQLIGQEGDSWQLIKSYKLKANGDTSLLTRYTKKEIWQQSEPGTLSLSFKKEGHLLYQLQSEDEKANLREIGQWSLSGDQLSFHPQKVYFDAEDPNQQWNIKRAEQDTLMLNRTQDDGQQIILHLVKQAGKTSAEA